jgi:hypothetical protein
MKTESIDRLPDVFLKCRTFTHAWEPQVTYLETVGRHTVHRCVLVCSREAAAGVPDPSEKEMLSYAKGRYAGSLVEPARYKLADGYLVSEQLGRGRQRPAARLELMTRQTTTRKLKAVK